jgi:hypothetical protein
MSEHNGMKIYFGDKYANLYTVGYILNDLFHYHPTEAEIRAVSSCQPLYLLGFWLIDSVY